MELCHVDVEDDVDLDSYDVHIPWLLNTTKLQKIKNDSYKTIQLHFAPLRCSNLNHFFIFIKSKIKV